MNFKPFEHWIKGDGKVEPLPIDKDVFGDGSVIVLNTPGHTPGHHSLLVKLPQMGNVVISAAMPCTSARTTTPTACRGSTTIASQTLASIDRMKKIVANFKATLDHPARRARHRQIAGVPGGREIIAVRTTNLRALRRPLRF